MAIPKIIGSQRDFSYGEVDVALKRADQHPAHKGGLRQMANARILNTGALQNRPGRRALYPVTNTCTRIEELTLSAGNIFKIEFGAGRWQIRGSDGSLLASSVVQGNGAVLPWNNGNVNSIIYAVFNLSIYVTFPGMRPQVITWDGVAGWTFADWTESLLGSGQKRTPFYRISPQNITMLPSAITGNITVKFSSAICVAGMTGTRMRFCGQQILLGTLISSTQMNATVIEPLPPGMTVTLTTPKGSFALGDVVKGSVSGAEGIVTASPNSQFVTYFAGTPFSVGDTVTGGTSGATGVITSINLGTNTLAISLNTGTAFVAGEAITGVPSGGSGTTVTVTPITLTVQLIGNGTFLNFFQAAETIIGPSGVATVNVATVAVPQAVAVWDDEVINSFRGYPASCFVDQFRVGFCNFPAVPGGILWSAINSPTDAYANDASSPSDAIFELAPGKVQVYFVVPGPESSEFVFCDTKIYYIPISTTTPLIPGSVGFQLLSGDGVAAVQPRPSQEAILYANAGQNTLMAIIATGAYNKPFNTRNLCEFHQHLFANIRCIAAPNADGTFNERYVYVLNASGSIVVGKYDPLSLQGNQPVIGWGPWSGNATVTWIAAWNADVLFTSSYFGTVVCEILDDTQYLDCALPVNAPPAAFAPPLGKGPLWFIPSQSVTLMDQVTRAMGTYQIDANGFIIPQFNGGENLAIASLVAGQPWTMTVEPFVADAPAEGRSMSQRMFKRRVSRMAVYVSNSTGFLMARLFAGPLTRTSPALGTIMNTHRVTTWNQDDDPTKPPPLREEAQRWRPIGRAYDPRVAVIKDTPGPLVVNEFGVEVSI
jgi:hypothetical protein